MVIRILDHISNASTYADGEVIYRLIASELDAGRDVAVSFEGIKSVSSAFINSALIMCYFLEHLFFPYHLFTLHFLPYRKVRSKPFTLMPMSLMLKDEGMMYEAAVVDFWFVMIMISQRYYFSIRFSFVGFCFL